MDVAIAGGHGQVARRLTRMLAARDDRVLGIIRKSEQAGDLRDVGAEPVLLDLEDVTVEGLAQAIAGAAAVVFAAGAGPGSGAARKETVDYGAAVKLIGAARQVGVDRYVMVSAMGTDDPPQGDEVFAVYLRAKARADEELQASGLRWTIVRPGRLTNDPGTGRVSLARHVDRAAIPREDVAAVLAAVLADDRTVDHVFEVVSGDTPIDEAIRRATG
ncbi:MAG TPA: NAD(P)H-binding protein [Nitriliruptorales bacterium]|nr:NAD(P)H-binding protein [Nitriliruptorales bacterium]